VHFDHNRSYVQPLSPFIQHAHTLSKVQYLAAVMSLKSLGFIK